MLARMTSVTIFGKHRNVCLWLMPGWPMGRSDMIAKAGQQDSGPGLCRGRRDERCRVFLRDCCAAWAIHCIIIGR
jgi:hypothetical protein